MLDSDNTMAFVSFSQFIETKPTAACFDDVAVGQIAYSTNRFSVDKNGEKRTASYYVPATAVSVGLDLGDNRAA